MALALAEAAAAAVRSGSRPPADGARSRARGHRARGFAFHWTETIGVPHPVPGIKMRVLALNKARGYATLLLDVAPGTRFPPIITAVRRSATSFPAACSRAAAGSSRAISCTPTRIPTTASSGPTKAARSSWSSRPKNTYRQNCSPMRPCGPVVVSQQA